jgi:hypothetical protein
MPAEPEGLAHALMELSRLAERLAGLDTREAEHFRQIADRLEQFGDALTAVEGTTAGFRTALDVLDELSGQVATQAAKLAEIVPDEDGEAKVYRPVPAPRWWKLDDEPREEALNKLRGWVEQIYRPMYGHLAALGPCWEKHPLCLVTLDWLSELWSVLYLQARRSAAALAGQAEFQTRLLPAAASQLSIETARCEHAQPRRTQTAGKP